MSDGSAACARQGNVRALQTDRWLAVRGSDSIFALGDAATIAMDRALEHAAELFVQARPRSSALFRLARKHFSAALEASVTRAMVSYSSSRMRRISVLWQGCFLMHAQASHVHAM